MTSDQLEKVKHLVGLFEKREHLYQMTTEKILEAVGPTALEALTTLFDVSYENIAWIETQLIDDTMLLIASINYEDDQAVPPIIQALSPSPEAGRASIRLFRVGLPLEVLFRTKQEIVDYLTSTATTAAQSAKEKSQGAVENNTIPVNVAKPEPEFDTSGLSHEQIQQLIMFGHRTRGTVH
jgi:hypothetical protein